VEYRYDPGRRGGGVCRERHDLHCLGHEASFAHRDFDMVVVANTLEHKIARMIAIVINGAAAIILFN
jgi:hypothetical protein